MLELNPLNGLAVRDLRQIKSRERVRDLAEVYTHKREVDAMLDLVAAMLPSEEDPGNTDRTFLEPACGSGNFLEEILRRKLTSVTGERFGRGTRYEHRVLRCLASIYGIDINQDNIDESRERLRLVVNSHLDNDLNTRVVSPGFVAAAEVILRSNFICADALADAADIVLIEYRPGRAGTFTRTWSTLKDAPVQADLFSVHTAPHDVVPVHYSELAAHPDPVVSQEATS